jgi:hypothetical protein
LGRLTDELPEPMTRDHFIAVQKWLRDAGWSGSVTMDNQDVQRLIDEIRWLKRRLRRVEFAIEPLAEAVRR